MGEEKFRSGLSSYLEKFRYGNAEGNDLWTELEKSSELNISSIIVSMTLSFLAFSIPGIVVYSFLGSYYHLYNIFTALYMLFLIFILILSTSAISFIISSLVNHVRNIWGITSILSIVMTVIPPTFYPYTYLLGKFCL